VGTGIKPETNSVCVNDGALPTLAHAGFADAPLV
jgi:hypothetical protein